MSQQQKNKLFAASAQRMKTPVRRAFQDDEVEEESREAQLSETMASLLAPPVLGLLDIDIDCIVPNPFQPRSDFDEEKLLGLATSIKNRGFLGRLRVRRHPEREGVYQLVYGERRWRGARMVPLKTIPCEVADDSDEAMEEIALLENIQREDLLPWEEGITFRRLLGRTDPLTGEKYSIRALAKRIGKEKYYVEDRLNVADVDESLREMMRQRDDTIRAAIVLKSLPDGEERQELIDGLKEKRYTLHHVRNRVREILHPEPPLPKEEGAERQEHQGQGGGGGEAPSERHGQEAAVRVSQGDSEVPKMPAPAAVSDAQSARTHLPLSSPSPVPATTSFTPTTERAAASTSPPLLQQGAPTEQDRPGEKGSGLSQQSREIASTPPLRQDYQTLQDILRRWREALPHWGNFDRTTVLQYTEEIITTTRQLRDELAR